MAPLALSQQNSTEFSKTNNQEGAVKDNNMKVNKMN